MFHKNLKIKNKRNKLLAVVLDIPKSNVKDYVIFNHCFTCSKNYKIYNNISKILLENGYATIRYDMMGLGNSEGDFCDSSFTTNIEDLISVYEYIKENYKAPKFLIGHSLGGLISIKASKKLNSIEGIATIGSPFNFNNLIEIFSKYSDEFDRKGYARISISGRDFNISNKFFREIKNEPIETMVQDFNKSIIIFHSDVDRVVNYKHGLKLFENINSHKNFITLKNVNHLVSERKDAYYIGNILSNWFHNI